MSLASSSSPFQRVIARALDLLLPPLCLACEAPVAAHGTLCAVCWRGVHFIAPPFCAACGAPFEVPMDEGAPCGGCIGMPPEYAAARAAMLYDDASKPIVLGFKHDRTHPAPALAAWMQRAGAAFWTEADFIVPVPLHRWRLFRRRYNQAALLAWEIGQLTGKIVAIDMLDRRRATPIQGHMSKKQQHENVAGAFMLNPRWRARLSGKTVILIDDVLTTGATVNECSKVLLKAGAAKVNVLTLARTRGML